jgi:hypothetical protein
MDGTTNKVRNVETVKPPTTVMAKGLSISSPSPQPKTRDRSPTIVVKLVD